MHWKNISPISEIQSLGKHWPKFDWAVRYHNLAIKTIRPVRPKVPYEDRKCQLCHTEVENEIHFLFRCNWNGYRESREIFIKNVTDTVRNFEMLSPVDKVVYQMIQEDTRISEALALYITEQFTNRKQQLH